MGSNEDQDLDKIRINEAQLILAEKRTNLAALRTGIAVFALPLGVVSFLIAMSRRFHAGEMSHFLTPLLIICICLATLGGYLVIRSVIKVLQNDHMLKAIKDKPRCFDELI